MRTFVRNAKLNKKVIRRSGERDYSNMNTLAINSRLDRLGIVASCVCAIHCLVTPMVLALLPLLGASFLADEMTENLLLLTAFVIGASSLIPGYFLHHRRALPIAVFGGGTLLIMAGRFWSDEGSWLETALSGLGVTLFAVSHFINYRLCAACCKVGEHG